jgi:hypothetical protein
MKTKFDASIATTVEIWATYASAAKLVGTAPHLVPVAVVKKEADEAFDEVECVNAMLRSLVTQASPLMASLPNPRCATPPP